MGTNVKSAGAFRGDEQGPASGAALSNQGLDQLNAQNSLYAHPLTGQLMRQYNKGELSSDAAMGKMSGQFDDGRLDTEFRNALATDATTGSNFATEQVQNNGILGQLYGKEGLMGKEIAKEQQLQNQGYQLTPEDHSLYGQTSGNIARMFGQQGNQAANDLASRGMSNSGAAGAMFSGIAGNQNEQLARAQEQIMQQRFQNTQNQIAQQQKMISTMGGQAGDAINQQFGRQVQGANYQRGGLVAAQSLQDGANKLGLQKSMFDVANKPENFMDQSIRNSDTASAAFAQSLGSAGGAMAGGGMGGGAPSAEATGKKTSAVDLGGSGTNASAPTMMGKDQRGYASA